MKINAAKVSLQGLKGIPLKKIFKTNPKKFVRHEELKYFCISMYLPSLTTTHNQPKYPAPLTTTQNRSTTHYPTSSKKVHLKTPKKNSPLATNTEKNPPPVNTIYHQPPPPISTQKYPHLPPLIKESTTIHHHL